MKYATFSKSAFAVSAILTGLVVAACANSADAPADDTTASPTLPAEAGAKLPSTTPTSTAPADKKCVPSCTKDDDCTNSCPALAGGVQCCDLKTNTCWGSKTSACPAQVDPGDASTPPAY